MPFPLSRNFSEKTPTGKARRTLPTCAAFLAAAALPALFSGCAGGEKEFQSAFLSGQYEAAKQIAIDAGGGEEKISARDELYWQLHAGSAAQLTGNAGEAVRLFDYADASFRDYDATSDAMDAAQVSLSLLWNDTAMPFAGSVYDRVMLNAYKGLAFMELGNVEYARVEFNRVLSRQDDAKVRFASEISKERTAVNQARRQNNLDKLGTSDPGKIMSAMNLEQTYLNLDGFAAYPDFVNPFATYLAGIFAWTENDIPKAVDLFKAASGMMPENSQLRADFAAADAGNRPANHVWILYENGLCPELHEVRVNLPTFLFSQNLLMVPLAFPVLRDRAGAHGNFYVEAAGKTAQAELVCDMDRVVRTEFNKRFPGIVAREITRTLLKSAAQYETGRQVNKATNGDWGTLAALGVALFQYASTGADTRSWTTLPKNFYAVSIPMPADRKLLLKNDSPASPGFSVEIPPCNNAVVYYRTPQATGVGAVIRVIPIGTPATPEKFPNQPTR